MTTFLLYCLKAAGCLVAFFLFYKLLLSRDTLHRLNRILLGSVLLLSFLLPVCVVTIEKELPYTPPVVNPSSVLAPDPEFYLPSVEVEDRMPEVFESADIPVEEPFDWMALGGIVYVIGACAMLCWTLWGLFSVVRLIRSGRQIPLDDGNRLVLIERPIVPFSWMRYIVMSEADYAQYGRTILLHERAHLRLGHSWDLLWIDLLGCLQWFNPAMWLLRRELRAVHEFEADESVLRAGVDAREYQLLLIKKAVGERWCSIANSLNHSNLKTRITMMLRKRSSKWARAKALYVLPLTLLALGAFARTTYVLPEDKGTNNFRNETPPSSANSLRQADGIVHSDYGKVVSSSMTILGGEKEDSSELSGQNVMRIYYADIEGDTLEEISDSEPLNETSCETIIVRYDTLSEDGERRDILKQILCVSDSVETVYDRNNHPLRYLKGNFRSVDGRNTYKVRKLKLQNLSGKKRSELPLVVADGRIVDITALTDELAGKILKIRVLSAEEAAKAGYQEARATNNGVIEAWTRNGKADTTLQIKAPRQTMRSQVTIQQDTSALDGRKMVMMYTSGNQQKMSITLTGDPETGVYSVDYGGDSIVAKPVQMDSSSVLVNRANEAQTDTLEGESDSIQFKVVSSSQAEVKADSLVVDGMNFGQLLLLLDGKEVTAPFIKSLDADQIESIRVVKNQTMIDRYGERAANGVVFISLRKEKPAREK